MDAFDWGLMNEGHQLLDLGLAAVLLTLALMVMVAAGLLGPPEPGER